MSDHKTIRGEFSGSGSAGTLTASGAQDSGSTTGLKGARGRLPGLPGTENDDCKQAYESHGLSGIGSESSPSCGWRGVYAAMGVRHDG